MPGNFCTRTARRIRLLGYAPERAKRLAGFIFTSMLSLYGMMGVLDVQPEEGYGWITGSGKSLSGTGPAGDCPAFLVCVGTDR